MFLATRVLTVNGGFADECCCDSESSKHKRLASSNTIEDEDNEDEIWNC